MILRKPYAFLIKHFKLINLLIGAFSCFIIYSMYNISRFFNSYVSNRYSGNFYEGFYVEYINALLYLAILVVIVGVVGMLVLFLYKKKKARIYLFSLIYFIVLIILLSFFKSVMVTLEGSVISAETARIYRDISLLALVPIVFFAFIFFLRGFGFRINQYNFQKDLRDLEISEKDREEVEVTLKGDTTKLRRNIRRFFREFTYYVKENKLMVSIISGGILIFIIYLLFNITFPKKLDTNFKQGDVFYYKNLSYKVEDSIVTNLNYRGEVINEGKYYIVMRVKLDNITKFPIEYKYTSFRLMLNNELLYPVRDYEYLFSDYAEGNTSEIVDPNSSKIVPFVYEINEGDIKRNYKVKMAAGMGVSKDVSKGKFNYILITPVLIDTVTKQQDIVLGKELSLINTYLGDTKLTLSNIVISNKLIYDYESCINNKCITYKNIVNPRSTDKVLLKADYIYKIDETVPFALKHTEIDGFLDTFMRVEYKNINDELIYSNVKSITPSSLKNAFVVEVPKEFETSEVQNVSITIRNKEYKLKIK